MNGFGNNASCFMRDWRIGNNLECMINFFICFFFCFFFFLNYLFIYLVINFKIVHVWFECRTGKWSAYWLYCNKSTVKASNFEPHGNFGPFFFRRACYYQKASFRNRNEIKVVDILSTCEVVSVHYWHRIRSKKLRIFQEMVQSFHEVQS